MVEKNTYKTKRYVHFPRLMAYVEQFKYVCDNDIVLEIGKGAGVFKYLASTIATCYVADVDPDLNPDYILDLTRQKDFLQLQRNFNKIFCCQVLEHVPFEAALKGLRNILDLGAEVVCISIPDNRRYFRICFNFARIKFSRVFSIPFTGKKIHIHNHTLHYWELYSANRNEIMRQMQQIAEALDYRIAREYRLFERPYQHFFIFERKK